MGGEAQLIKLSLLNANLKPEIIATDMQEGKVNFFRGNNPEKWKTNIPTYLGVLYKEVYKGIDVKYYGNNSQIEYDIIVKPGADPSKVAFSYDGIKGIKVLENGDLEIALNEGSIVQKKPYIYQEINGKRVEVNGRFVIPENKSQTYSYGFKVASYNKEHNLIIDPVLVYSTYIGGSNNEEIRDIKVDSSGNVYVTGDTYSIDFNTVSPIYGTNAGSADVFVTKMAASGTALIYSTYIGGSAYDRGSRLFVDASGSVYFSGQTASADFPTVSPVQASNGGGVHDAFVAKIDALGSSLVYSTYLGGGGDDGGRGIAVDAAGAIYVAGWTSSTDFPTVAPIQGYYNGGLYDAFVTKLNASGSAFVYSTYLGGSSYDWGSYLSLDNSGNAYITGETDSIDYPTVSALQGAYGGGGSDAFVTKVNSSGSAIVFSTYIGGSGYETSGGITLDTAGDIYITGETDSTDFPVASPLQGSYAGGWTDIFVTKINAAGSSLIYSTYLGGTGEDIGNRIAVDSTGSAYITGWTFSTNFPAFPFIRWACGDCPTYSDAFVTKINPSGSGIDYYRYLGGINNDEGRAIAVDSAGNAYIGGVTYSPDYPRISALQSGCMGCPTSSQAFVTKVSTAISGDIEVSTAVANEIDETSVAFDGTNYLVVWGDDRSGVVDIYGRLFTTSGIPVGSEFIISSTFDYKGVHKVYFGGGYYLVVWEDYRNGDSDIYGQIVSTSGTLNGSEIAISNNLGTEQIHSSIGFDGTNYFVVWEDNRYGTFDIYGRFVTTTGTLAGPRFAISSASGDQYRPQLKFDGTKYLVVWRDSRTGTFDIYGQFVSASGSLVGGEIAVGDAVGPMIDRYEAAHLDFDGTNYFVAWTDHRGTKAEIYGQRLTAAGALLDPEIAISTTDPQSKRTRQVLFNGSNRYLVIWRDGGVDGIYTQATTRQVRAQFVTTAGLLSGSEIAISTAAPYQTHGSIAYDGTNYLVVWDDNRNGIDERVYGNFISGTTPSGNTSSGTSVAVAPLPDVSLNFSSVSTAGNTTITTSSSGTPPPSGFNLGNSPTYYEITTTAVFSGPVQVCFNYNPANFGNENLIRLFHFNGSTWNDITDAGYPDTGANLICGTTTSFSPFVIAQEASTAVSLSNLTAVAEEGEVVLKWSTSSESDNEGFTILRGETINGPFVPITPSLIPALGGIGMRAVYTYSDSNVELGKTYYYRLQDVDYRGRASVHEVISAIAGGGQKQEARSEKLEDNGGKSEDRSKKQEVRSETSETEGKTQASQQITSVVVAAQEMKQENVEVKENPPVSPFDKGGIQSLSLDVIEPRLATGTVPSDHIASSNLSDRRQKQFPDNHASEPSVRTSASSSFSVTIEDEIGNLISISKMNNAPDSDASANELDVKEDTGKVVLTWQGIKPVKGFVIYRAEKGKKEYSPITSLIPYFGNGKNDVLQYRFIDNGVKKGVKYEYRMEVVDSSDIVGKKPA